MDPPQADPQPNPEVSLLEAVVALGAHAATFNRAFNENQENHVKAHEATINALIERIQAMPLGGRPTSDPATPKGRLKFREPRVFDGKVKSVRPFLDEIESAVWLQRHALVTDFDKFLYLSGYLKDGSPKSWYYSIRNTPERAYLLNDWDGVLEDFRSHFGDSDRHATASEEMENLRQTGSCASFASRFRELLVDLELNEPLKIEYFRKRLKDNVLDALALIKRKDLPTDFDEYVDICISIDNSLHRREMEKKKKTGNNFNSSAKQTYSRNSGTSTPSSSFPQTSTTTAVLPPGTPMEIDATKTGTPRGPLTKEERERRRREGLCAYCGGKHSVDDCPNMSERAKKATAARKASPNAGKA